MTSKSRECTRDLALEFWKTTIERGSGIRWNRIPWHALQRGEQRPKKPFFDGGEIGVMFTS